MVEDQILENEQQRQEDELLNGLPIELGSGRGFSSNWLLDVFFAARISVTLRFDLLMAHSFFALRTRFNTQAQPFSQFHICTTIDTCNFLRRQQAAWYIQQQQNKQAYNPITAHKLNTNFFSLPHATPHSTLTAHDDKFPDYDHHEQHDTGPYSTG